MALTDPMNFELVRDAIGTLLSTAGAGYFRVVEGQKQSFSSDEFTGTDRTVQVFYSDGDYEGSMQRINAHDCTFKIEYYVSSPCKADLSVLDDPASTPAQLQAAIAGKQAAFFLVDRAMDELRRITTQIILSPAQKSFGLARHTVSKRWLTGFRKTQVFTHGRLVQLNATENLTCRVSEALTGVTPTLGVAPVIDITQNPQPITGAEVTPPSEGMQTEQ